MKISLLVLLVVWTRDIDCARSIEVDRSKMNPKREVWELKRMNRVLAAVNRDPCKGLYLTSLSRNKEITGQKMDAANLACYNVVKELQALPKELAQTCISGKRAKCRLHASWMLGRAYVCSMELQRTSSFSSQHKQRSAKNDNMVTFAECGAAVVAEFARYGQTEASKRYEDPPQKEPSTEPIYMGDDVDEDIEEDDDDDSNIDANEDLRKPMLSRIISSRSRRG